MTTLSTHDTKRGEDVRARIAVLAEPRPSGAELVAALAAPAPVPDRAFGYLLWQTLAGAGALERDRCTAYAEKAMREAGERHGPGPSPTPTFEAAVHAAVDAAYDDAGSGRCSTGSLTRVRRPAGRTPWPRSCSS